MRRVPGSLSRGHCLAIMTDLLYVYFFQIVSHFYLKTELMERAFEVCCAAVR